nr:transmembrane protein 272 [Parasteatoda tepidariorum]
MKNKENVKNPGLSDKKPSMYLFPILRLKLAWTSSSNVFEFVLRVIAIVFSTLGWLCCVGGIPLMSIAMLIIGSIYVKDCNIQPNIPVYLIVSGVFGTLQHFIAVWTKYIPKDSQGAMRVYRAYCKVIDCTLEIFLIIWFVLGCIWVYGVPAEIDFHDTYKDEYCNKTVYYFAFWILNLSFILLLLLVVITLFVILCVVIFPKDEMK